MKAPEKNRDHCRWCSVRGGLFKPVFFVVAQQALLARTPQVAAFSFFDYVSALIASYLI